GPRDGVRDDRPVLDREDAPPVVAVVKESPQHTLDLPGLTRARREVLGPGEVELEDQLLIARQELLVLDEPHEPAVVGDDRLGARPEHRDLRRHAHCSALMSESILSEPLVPSGPPSGPGTEEAWRSPSRS